MKLEITSRRNQKGYARGEQAYHNASPIVDSDENEFDNNDEDDDDYDTDRCSDDEFTCKNAQCISAIHRCDGTRNCNDGSDESNCAFNKNAGDYNAFRLFRLALDPKTNLVTDLFNTKRRESPFSSK